MGDSRAEVLSAIRDEGKTSISFTSDADGSGSGSLLDSILFTFLKKCSSDVWVVALFFFFLIRDNKLRWVAFRMAAATFVYHSMVKS